MTGSTTARSLALVAATALPVLVLDHATKAAANAGGLAGGWFEPARNEGLALGLAAPLAGASLTGLIGLVAAVVVVGRMLLRDGRPAVAAAAGVVLGASIGNLADRFAGDGVRDFIVGPGILYNLADVALAAGVLALVVIARRRPPVAT